MEGFTFGGVTRNAEEMHWLIRDLYNNLAFLRDDNVSLYPIKVEIIKDRGGKDLKSNVEALLVTTVHFSTKILYERIRVISMDDKFVMAQQPLIMEGT